MNPWYAALAKPAWTPAPAVIGAIWTVLYPIIFAAYGYAAAKALGGAMPRTVLLPIAINLAANFAFTPIQFGLKSLPLASLDILVVLLTIPWSMALLWPYSRLAAAALSPYLVWVGIATVLQLSITWMNR